MAVAKKLLKFELYQMRLCSLRKEHLYAHPIDEAYWIVDPIP
jgi:hypothetical protein